MEVPSMRMRREGGEIVTILIVLIVVAVVILGGYKLVGVAADWVAERIPDQVEADLFSRMGDDGKWSSEASTPDRKRAQAIFESLKRTPGLRALPYKLRFVADHQPNAFAMPGGTLAV